MKKILSLLGVALLAGLALAEPAPAPVAPAADLAEAEATAAAPAENISADPPAISSSSFASLSSGLSSE